MRVTADKYYGLEAELYDVRREETQRWQIEQQAVTDFVEHGPVLDIPFGTGRYVPIYRSKGLEFFGVDLSPDMLEVAQMTHGNVPCSAGSIFDQPCVDGVYATAVCTRLLDWLKPSDMVDAIRELRRVARTLIVTLRHGEPGVSINYTHDLDLFYEAIYGLFIADRRTTEISKHGHEEIFKLRPPCWADVEAQFLWHDGPAAAEIERITGVRIDANSAKLTAHHWTAEECGTALDDFGGLHSSYENRPAPRYDGAAVTIVKHDGRCHVPDGMRRLHRWRQTEGRYPVLLIEV